MEQFSVLMSLYIKEHAEYFDECMQSVLNQTVFPSEIVVVEDGPITDELRAVLNKYKEEYPELIKSVVFEKNQGLGLALRAGVEACSNELIARMDTDDIARDDRFEKQLRMFADDLNLDICGSHIIEFGKDRNDIISQRRVPLKHDEIARYQKRRSAFNHMTVMFKRSSVLQAGNYEHCPLMEDDMLWVRMILSGANCANVDDYLVYARVGAGMIARRGGISYFRKYKQGRKMILKTGFISIFDYCTTIIVQLAVCITPTFFRKQVFQKLLRKEGIE